MHDLAHQHLLRAQAPMKQQADKDHSERHFAEGDLVFLKLQPYVETSMACRSREKLSFKFFDPYRTIARVGSVAYMLEIPLEANIHPVFHVSMITREHNQVSSLLLFAFAAFQVLRRSSNAAGLLMTTPSNKASSSRSRYRRRWPLGKLWPFSVSSSSLRAPAWRHAGSKKGRV